MKKTVSEYSYWSEVWKQFKRHRLGWAAFIVVVLFCLVGVYAPFLASSKPLVVYFDGEWYFPLFRYLFYRGFYSKPLDLFFNLLIFTLPIFLFLFFALKRDRKLRKIALLTLFALHMILFFYICFRVSNDPAIDLTQSKAKQAYVQMQLNKEKSNPLLASSRLSNWQTDLSYMNGYAELNMLLSYQQKKEQYKKLAKYEPRYELEMKKKGFTEQLKIPVLWNLDRRHEEMDRNRYLEIISRNEKEYPQAKGLIAFMEKQCQDHALNASNPSSSHEPFSSIMECDYLAKLSQKDVQSIIEAKEVIKKYESAQSKLGYMEDKQEWLEKNVSKLRYEVMPLIRSFHWEDDAGGSQELNRHISWLDLTRINRKDMVAALIFGVRISLSVGITAVGLALLIGIPIGALSGYYGGKFDIVAYRMIEIWESMPTFFMLLMVVGFFHNKSIFIVIVVIGLFGWTSFSRFVRGEFLRQKQLPYIEACRAMGFSDRYIMFSHILPNAIPPLLTLIPFAIMGAITSEAGLSFLGLGEEGSGSWGVLMDEGRSAFPSESYLLWPPAILLTIFLVAIALMGDALRDALDPKIQITR